jgi:Flp pilus assembly protein TadD
MATVGQNPRTASDIRRAELERDLAKKWENPSAHYELGQLYRASGDWSKAEWHYNTALGFDPAMRDAQAAIVKLQLDKGDKSRAKWAADNYIVQVASSPEQLLALGVAFEKQGLDDYANKCYQDALKLAPNSPRVNRQLGYYYLAKNDKDLAKEYFIRSFQLNPNQPDVAGELGRLGVAVKIPEAPEPQPSPENLSQHVKPATQPK